MDYSKSRAFCTFLGIALIDTREHRHRDDYLRPACSNFPSSAICPKASLLIGGWQYASSACRDRAAAGMPLEVSRVSHVRHAKRERAFPLSAPYADLRMALRRKNPVVVAIRESVLPQRRGEVAAARKDSRRSHSFLYRPASSISHHWQTPASPASVASKQKRCGTLRPSTTPPTSLTPAGKRARGQFD